MYSINNISFDTDGKTVKVPPEKGNGKIILGTKEDFKINEEEYMQYGKVEQNTIEDVNKTKNTQQKKEGTGRGE